MGDGKLHMLVTARQKKKKTNALRGKGGGKGWPERVANTERVQKGQK